jgi:DtxR family Mn-dependent transcriptional regulator
MLSSQTVENYLKTIYQAQAAGLSHRDLVPMGQIATALGVVPGTATTMVKTLAESGLVYYEPYMGVRLTPAGEKLASLVLRRHRLVELFLVKVLGMSWAEVHDEAEQLEHAVSERVIDRIDELLGRPSVDPHGDPIPTAEGTIAPSDSLDLSTAPLGAPMVVTRITNQDSDFLRFIEQHELMPGKVVVVTSRSTNADAVALSAAAGPTTTLGTRAARHILVRPRA